MRAHPFEGSSEVMLEHFDCSVYSTGCNGVTQRVMLCTGVAATLRSTTDHVESLGVIEELLHLAEKPTIGATRHACEMERSMRVVERDE